MNTSLSMRRIAILVAALVATVIVLPQPAMAASTYANVEQIGVDSFVDAGLAVSQRSFTPDGTSAVVLATDANFPDGLTASAVAGSVDAPVLFTGPATLDPDTAAEIDRLLDDGDTVFVMGGTSAIADTVTDALGDYTVVRIAGESRIETAVAAGDVVGVPADGRVLLARAFGPEGANVPSDRTTGWVDAISCGAYAAAAGLPIYLTQTEVLTGATRDALAMSTATDVTICGGVAAVSDAVAAELNALGLTVDRVEGVTRVETAVDAAKTLFGHSTAAGHSYVLVPGYGESFGYGLAAAPLGMPILLVGQTEPTACTDGSQPSRETLCYLETATSGNPADLLVIGDGSIVSDEVADAAGEAAGGTDIGDLPVLDAPVRVTAVDDLDDDGTQLTVGWDEVEDPDDILAGYNVMVDGVRVGTEPTVGGNTSELLLTGLTRDREVTITVAAVDEAGRESAPSAGVDATPKDEAPKAIGNFLAAPFDGEVRLSWDRGPVDAASYTISRGAPAASGTCDGTTYTQITKITNPATLTFVDSTVTNGTRYCYRHVVTDEAGQDGAPSDKGPVTPAVPALSVAITNIPDDFVFHTGFPHPITTTTTLPQDTPFSALQRVVEYIPDDTAFTPIIIAEGQHPATADVTTIFQLREDRFIDANGRQTATAAGNRPTTDYTGTGQGDTLKPGTLRVSVFRPGTSAAAQDAADIANVSRAPEQIAGLQALGGNNLVVVTWTASPEPTTTQYAIERAAVNVTAATDDPAVCNDNNPAADYVTVETRPITIANATTYRDGNVSNDGDLGSDIRYCYRVRALRPSTTGLPAADQNGDYSAIDSANPDIVASALTIEAPSGSSVVSERGETVVRWTIAVPENGTPTTDTTLLYCLDYRSTLPGGTPTCQDAGGFKAMNLVGDTDNVVTTVVGAKQTMTFTARWNVPNINQGTTQRGAVRLTTQGSSDTNDGIQFL